MGVWFGGEIEVEKGEWRRDARREGESREGERRVGWSSGFDLGFFFFFHDF